MLCHPGVGGSVRAAVELANALVGRGHEVVVLAREHPMGGGVLDEAVTFHRVAVDRAPLPPWRLDRGWSAAEVETLVQQVAEVARSAGLDVLHAHYADPFAEVAAAVRRRVGSAAPATVVTLHGTDVDRALAPDQRRSLRSTLESVDAVTTVSQDHAALTARLLRMPWGPKVIPNFVEPTRFHPRGGQDAHRPRRLVHVSNFRPVKRVGALARIFVAVRRLVPVELWLVGDGEAMPTVRTILRDAGVEPAVRYLGLRTATGPILRRCDLLLVTSRRESFCLVALEAAACGLPVVAPRVGGIPEVVDDGRTGVLVRPHDDEAAVRAAVALLTDDPRRRAMGQEAVRSARRFSPDAVVPRYERLYERVCERPG